MLRLPGYGIAPGALTRVDWQPWLATTRLAVREATRLAGGDVPLHLAWPQDMYSLSHIAAPFPITDSLYGREPREKNLSGISPGTISLRGETATLSVGLDTLMRATSNPFFPYLLQRINQRLPSFSEHQDVQYRPQRNTDEGSRGDEAEKTHKSGADAKENADAG